MEWREDDYQGLKLVLESTYELKHGEYYLDDVEDMALTYAETEESEYGLMNDEDDSANEGREDEESFQFGADTEPPEAEAEEMEYEADDDLQAFLNNEKRGEIATWNPQARRGMYGI